MEKEINQDFTILWPAWRAMGVIVVFLLISCGVFGVLRFGSAHDWVFLASMVPCSAVSFWCIRHEFRKMLERAKESTRRWFLTDAGLTRCYDSDERETIRWEQIRDVRWARYSGLKVSWEESKRDDRLFEFQSEFRKQQNGRYWCLIRIGESEAQKIMEARRR
jgi:hypothetical protein